MAARFAGWVHQRLAPELDVRLRVETPARRVRRP
jgi:hypothetical protein